MYKVSQEIQLNANGSSNHNEVFGKYLKSSDNDNTNRNDRQVFVSPELSEVHKIQVIHFPEEPVAIDSEVKFIIEKNGARGNLDVKIETPAGNISSLPLHFIDVDRLEASVCPKELGVYKVAIKLNGVKFTSGLPLIIVVEKNVQQTESPKIPIFHSDATKAKCSGLGLEKIKANANNEFTVDASNAGTNILFIGICGPKGQCDEVTIRHIGRNVYNVLYQVQDRGQYILAVKWGDDHIPGSPFYIKTSS